MISKVIALHLLRILFNHLVNMLSKYSQKLWCNNLVLTFCRLFPMSNDLYGNFCTTILSKMFSQYFSNMFVLELGLHIFLPFGPKIWSKLVQKFDLICRTNNLHQRLVQKFSLKIWSNILFKNMVNKLSAKF